MHTLVSHAPNCLNRRANYVQTGSTVCPACGADMTAFIANDNARAAKRAEARAYYAELRAEMAAADIAQGTCDE